MELDRKRVMVVGLGVSGRAAANFLGSRGALLTMVDKRVDLARDGLPEGRLLLGSDNPAWLEGIELLVLSPGVPTASNLVTAARAKGIKVIGELELAARFTGPPIIGITGTNGKSTVTELLGKIFQAAGRKAFVGGNLGTPLIDAAGGDYEIAVVEVSSYQLETIERFRPRVAVHLNLSADHLDRYASLEDYARAKERIFENQNSTDWAVLNRDDPMVWSAAPRLKSRIISFGLSRPQSSSALWYDAGVITFDDDSRGVRIPFDNRHLQGNHNRLNAMAAAAAALAMEVRPDVIADALASFRGLPHRIEFVREKKGVRFIDDSKGTNVGAVIEALAATPAPIILIAGGVDKRGSYAPLARAMRDKVKLVILIGAAREKMSAELKGTTAIACVETLDEAVTMAVKRSQPGDSVLLSPACSSFDQFKDYAERGRIFQELVRAL